MSQFVEETRISPPNILENKLPPKAAIVFNFKKYATICFP